MAITRDTHGRWVCHCGAIARNDDSDYESVCCQWPLCEGGMGRRVTPQTIASEPKIANPMLSEEEMY